MGKYRIKWFFPRVYSCISGADVLTNVTGRLYKVCECIGIVFTYILCTWTPDKNRFILIILQWEYFPYLSFFIETFTMTTWPLHSRVVYRGVIYTQKCSSGTQKFIELWTDQTQIYTQKVIQARIKNKQVTVLLSNQKPRKRYTLLYMHSENQCHDEKGHLAPVSLNIIGVGSKKIWMFFIFKSDVTSDTQEPNISIFSPVGFCSLKGPDQVVQCLHVNDTFGGPV